MNDCFFQLNKVLRMKIVNIRKTLRFGLIFNFENSDKRYYNSFLMSLILLFLFIFNALLANAGPGYVKLDTNEPNINLSSKYTVTVNGISIPVIKLRGSVAPSYVHFSFAGQIDIKVTVNEPVAGYDLSPHSFNISSSQSGNDINFSLDRPRHLILHHVNSSFEDLSILAEGIEENPPKIGDFNVKNIMDTGVDNIGGSENTSLIQSAINNLPSNNILYFPAGRYITQKLQLKSNMSIYLADGAVLEASTKSTDAIIVIGNGSSNVKIYGRGVLEGRGDVINMDYAFTWIDRGTRNIKFEGIMLRNSVRWNCGAWGDNITFNDVHIITNYDRVSKDGVAMGGTNITVNNCFMLTTDDAIAVNSIAGSNDYHGVVTNSFFFNGIAGGRIFMFGPGCSNSSRFYRFENNDASNGHYMNEITGHAVEFWPGGAPGNSWQDIQITNFRVEQPPNSFIGIYNNYNFGVYSSADGKTDKIIFREITQSNFGPGANPVNGTTKNELGYGSFQGGKNNTNTNITFDNYYVAGDRITNYTQGQFNVGSHTSGVTFPANSNIIVEINASDLFADGLGSNTGQFTVSRTGDLASPLTVDYTIHGTATNGSDYNTIKRFVSIPSGKSSTTITISPIVSSTQWKTVFISLNNNFGTYIVGKNYHAVVSIVNKGS